MWYLARFVLNKVPLTVWTFLRDVGPLIAYCVGASLLAMLAYLTLVAIPMEKRNMRRWLEQNRATLQKVMVLGYFARALGRRVPACGNCGQTNYHLWNCGLHQVVYRCSNCRYSYSLSDFAYPEIRYMQQNLPALMVLLGHMKAHRGGLLARWLQKLCTPLQPYCRKRLASRTLPRVL